MVELKFADIIGFRTEDPKYPTANLLKGQRWLCEKNWGSSVNDVTFRLEKVDVISAVDVGNFGTAFITIEVSRVGLGRYQILLPSTSLMTAEDCKANENWSCVRMFTEDDFVPEVGEQKWDLVRVVCMQPFIRNVQFGLSFFKLFSSLKRIVEQVDLNVNSTPKSSFLVRRPVAVALAKPLSRSEKLVEEVKKNCTTSTCGNKSDQVDLSPSIQPLNCSTSCSAKANTTPFLSDRENVLSRSSQVKPVFPKSSFTESSSKESSSRKTSVDPTSKSKVEGNNCCPSTSFLGKSKGTSALLGHVSGKSPLAKPRRQQSKNVCSSSKVSPSQCGTNAVIKRKADLDIPYTGVGDVICLGSDSDSDSTVIFASETTPTCKKESFPSENGLPAKLRKKKRASSFDDSDSDTNLAAPSTPNSISSDTTDIILYDYDYQSKNGVQNQSTKSTCPICSEEFLVTEIEQHAESCFAVEEPDVLVCPICNRHFPPDILPQHADICAERSANQ